MKKIKYGLFVILIFATILLFPTNVKSFYWAVSTFETDKTTYFVDDQITINASWDIYYNPNTEIAYIQAQIYDNLNNLIWNSSECYEIGVIEEIWDVNINSLNLNFPFSNTSYISLQVRLFVYFLHIDSSNTIITFLETIEIQVTKKDISCGLIGFKDKITFGENLKFEARFFDSLTSSNLINKLIMFEIISNNVTYFQANYTTNSSGSIWLNLSTYEQLKIGVNNLLFSAKSDMYYNKAIFSYEVLVNKSNISVNIISFKEMYNATENIEIVLYYYYNFNTTLKNATIKTIFINNGSIIYEYNQSTDNLGLINITIPSNLLMLNETHKNHTITAKFLFPQTKTFKNNSFSLEFIIEGIQIKTKHNIIQDLIFIGTIISIYVVAGTLLYLKKKRRKNSEKVEPAIDGLSVNNLNIEEINMDEPTIEDSNIEEINMDEPIIEEINDDYSDIEEINTEF